jgi:type I restriction enzyme R subunit
LDEEESALDPLNPNVRGYHEEPADESPLDEIIRAFNERWFSAWDATPEEQRIKLINIVREVKKNLKFTTQVVNNPDGQNRKIALDSLIGDAINKERRRKLDL